MRTPRAPAAGILPVVLCTLVLLVGGCGGGPTAPAWAASVCDALSPWRLEIDELTSSAQQQMTAQTTPAQAKENLVRMMAGAERASEDARRGVAEAGVPDVSQGDLVSDGFLDSLTQVRDAYGRAKRSIEQLDTGRPEPFYDGVEAAVDTLNKEYDASGLDTSKLNSPELKQAFDEVPECR
ncbi:hypothetical protein ACI2K4_14190 [Micromonospora sp. NPDC050397]|uniref:hypothetical protein n=1 Tax=Micromonospora sp. NPDC050397 TaxID=3364279 RepID=UPI00384EE8D9